MSGTQMFTSLCTGASMPLMAFGTLMESLKPDPVRTVSVIEDALEVGYRHLDTAQVYNTETHVGEAVRNKIKQGLISREDVFITSKLWRNAFRREDVVPSLKESLAVMGLDYIDLFLVHWPTAFKSGEEMFPKNDHGEFECEAIHFLDTWKGMEECFNLGLTKAIGLSNFNSKQIQLILDQGLIKPANIQIESHPFLTNTKLVDFCQSRGISVCAYAPLAGFNAKYREERGWHTIYEDPVIFGIANKHNKTPAQIALRFQLQRNVAVAPKSSRQERMEENFKALSFHLTQEDMDAIEAGNKNWRLNAELPDHPYFPFNEEF